MLRKVKDVSLNPSIQGHILNTFKVNHCLLRMVTQDHTFTYTDGFSMQVINTGYTYRDNLNITRISYNVFRVSIEIYYMLRSSNDSTKRMLVPNLYHTEYWDASVLLKINLQGLVNDVFTKHDKIYIGVDEFIVKSVLKCTGDCTIELAYKEVNTDIKNPWDTAYDTPTIPLSTYDDPIYKTDEYVHGICAYNNDRSMTIYQATKKLDYLNSVRLSVDLLVQLDNKNILTEKKLRSFWFKNTPKIININKFRGNYSKITNIDSNYMSYPLINKNKLRREVA